MSLEDFLPLNFRSGRDNIRGSSSSPTDKMETHGTSPNSGTSPIVGPYDVQVAKKKGVKFHKTGGFPNSDAIPRHAGIGVAQRFDTRVRPSYSNALNFIPSFQDETFESHGLHDAQRHPPSIFPASLASFQAWQQMFLLQEPLAAGIEKGKSLWPILIRNTPMFLSEIP